MMNNEMMVSDSFEASWTDEERSELAQAIAANPAVPAVLGNGGDDMNTNTISSTKSYPFLSKAEIKTRIAADQAFAFSCLLVIFDRQTAYEQTSETTLNRNRMGFMSSHAVHGTRISKKIRSGEDLTDEDRSRAVEISSHYTKQLASHFRAEAISENPALKQAGQVFGV